MSWAAPIQSNLGAFGSSTSARSVSYLSNVGSGNLLVVCASIKLNVGSNGSVTISDTLGNTYNTAVSDFNNTAGGQGSVIFWCTSGSGGANTVTITPFSGSTDIMTITVLEYAEPGTVSVFSSGRANGSSVAPSVSNITVSTNDNLVIAVCGFNNTAASITAGSGYTLEQSQTSGAGLEYSGVEDQANVTTTQTPSFTIGSSQGWRIAAACFQAIVSAPSGDQYLCISGCGG